jgi:beta-glucosidase
MNAFVKCPITLGALLLATSGLLQGGAPGGNTLTRFDRSIDRLLKQMTLEEKVGQMTQVTIDLVSVGLDGRQEPHALDMGKLEDAILRHHVGSILNVGPSSYTLAHWHEVITAIQDVATKKTRLQIPVLYGIDAVHGANYTRGATLFPQEIGIAATWDPELSREVGRVTALEVRASGIPWNFSPVLDLGRQPLWPRLWETYGEDVLLARTMGRAYVQGMMGDDMGARERIAPCLKHYAGYSAPLSGKDRTPAWIDERMMREYFLPPFEEGIKAGVPSVMVNSGELNGIPGHSDYHLLTEILKQEWDFAGFTVSDWGDIERLHTRDRVADSPKEAVRMAVMAGVDMSMVPLDFSFYDLLLELVKEGKVPVSRIDDAVRRILRVKYAVGLFEDPYPDRSLEKDFASEKSSALNRRVAQESITLLKNEQQLLPLSKDVRILVTGPTANLLSSLNSGWTITWQGNEEALYPKEKWTILEAIERAVTSTKVTYVPGSDFERLLDLPAAVAAADSADVILACLGERAYCETPGNINDLTLDEPQLRLVDELARTGKPIILVLAEGRPRLIHRILGKVGAILLAYLPGMEGGRAVADLLFGDANPSGKLPITYPAFPNSLVHYDGKPAETADGNSYNPEFPFGFGLSYTTFAYSDLRLGTATLKRGGRLAVSVMVRNTGNVAGKEVVELYVSDLYRSVTPPAKELKAFSKIFLEPGEGKRVEFALTSDDLSFIGRGNRRITENGTFRLSVEGLSAEFELR